MNLKDFGEWEKRANEKHPLLANVFCQVIATGASAGLTAFLGLSWLSHNLPPRPSARVEAKTSQESDIWITNQGILPATTKYSVVSGDQTAVFSIQEGKDFVLIRDTNEKNKKDLLVRDLPRDQKIKISVAGGDSVFVSADK